MLNNALHKTAAVASLIFLLTAPGYAFSQGKDGDSEVRLFCEKTIPSYVSAFADGQREPILLALAQSEAFEALDPFQQSAFARLLGQSKKTTPDQAAKQCLEMANRVIEKASSADLAYCESWSRTVFNIASLVESGSFDEKAISDIAGQDGDLRSVVSSVAAQAESLANGAGPEDLARAHYYTCFKEAIEE